MLFSSLTFLLYFLPPVVVIHYFLPRRWQNVFLLAASLIFYAWGDVSRAPLFAGLLAANYLIGRGIGQAGGVRGRRALLALGLACDFGALAFYKYAGFLLGMLGIRFEAAGALPLGISFFTFQAAGYLIDVFRGDVPAEKNAVTFGTFLFLFPQLIAGPIVRYGSLRESLHERRRPAGPALERGMLLFILGLAAKTLLANPLGEAYGEMRACAGDMACAWLSLTAYTLQIYFDFLGYSVMAIGIGQMLGFSFPRNFRHPYAARSVTEFWRRWHITLSGWFRDYVYIPLGGSRRGKARTALNLLAVWSLTGLWHGADWTFLLWGLWYFALLAAEKFLLPQGKTPAWLGRTLTLAGVMLGWALFVSEGLDGFARYLSDLFCFRAGGQALFWLREYAALFLLAVLCCIPRVTDGVKAFFSRRPPLRFLGALLVLMLCLAALASSSYNPFLYFRF